MTAEDQAAATVDPDDGRSLARAIARQALAAGRRHRAAGDRREFGARAEQVRRAAASDPPSPIATAATTDVAEPAGSANSDDSGGSAAQNASRPEPAHEQPPPDARAVSD